MSTMTSYIWTYGKIIQFNFISYECSVSSEETVHSNAKLLQLQK